MRCKNLHSVIIWFLLDNGRCFFSSFKVSTLYLYVLIVFFYFLYAIVFFLPTMTIRAFGLEQV